MCIKIHELGSTLTHFATPFDDHSDLLANAIFFEGRLQLGLGTVSSFLLLDDLLELLELFLVTARQASCFLSGVGNVLQLIWITKNDLRCATLK